MKAILTLIYEKDVRNDEEKQFLEEAVRDGDDQMLSETFGIGWETPISSRIEYKDN